MTRRMCTFAFSVAAVLFPATFTGMRANDGTPGLTARITMVDGSSRTARIDGVGCSLSICSRTIIQGKNEDQSLVKTRLDLIASIRDTTAGEVLFVMKDGTQRRLSLVKDFRVLYLAGHLGGAERLDLAQVRSVDFVRAGK
ncbi:MAG TPA: hypothetical protein VK789_32770 [Bryobacteraceae bacterium]|jgi:hypothetical protein|nr:hypothetical protein [Bryobacteraceae bacterium]